MAQGSESKEAVGRGFQPRVSAGQDLEIEQIMAELDWWPSKQAFVREAVNKQLAWAWRNIEAKHAKDIPAPVEARGPADSEKTIRDADE